MAATDHHSYTLNYFLDAYTRLIERLSDCTRQPREREADYLLAKVLQAEVEEAGLTDNPDIRNLFLKVEKTRLGKSSQPRFPHDL